MIRSSPRWTVGVGRICQDRSFNLLVLIVASRLIPLAKASLLLLLKRRSFSLRALIMSHLLMPPTLIDVRQKVARFSIGPFTQRSPLLSTRLSIELDKIVTSYLAVINGENVIESYGLSFKALEKIDSAPTTTARPRLILSARLAPGVAVPLQLLFSALGSKCTQDGMLTVQDSSTLAQGFNLPLSEQAQAAVSHGQKAVSLFATVS